MSDIEIIEQLKQGSEAAFKKLVDMHQKLVVNTCYGLVQNREDAEDIAQDVFVEVYRKIDKFRADAKLSTWLYRIAVNRSLNHIRNNKKHRWFQGFENEVAEKNRELLQARTADSDEPEYDFENKQRAIILKEAINSLPQNQKVAFTLSKYEDLSYQEIAEVMNLSVPSVESLLFRAKKGLQKKLYKCYKKKCM
ncbi:RNA polymerase sigma factor [Draconibacterium halophilum]|uniref:RNA polymerase sigma factor n=1 Tax=Draconibacterium halophilum TaxID=2706887 RepID=A0A6C0R9Z0_9BACT|nr:sigma-70 family RNA polymerase sigma factor [Draconibacterium halophilum]QIA06782.1 sigma-70 family RNA polymerase sigma factor [Draconibacterium halophilum]